MASNNQTVVISFSIALFLLLILLLLITYNSKCQMDNVENFLGNPVDSANFDRNLMDLRPSSIAEKLQNGPNFSVDKSIGSESAFYSGNIAPSDPDGDAYNEPVVRKPPTPTPHKPVVSGEYEEEEYPLPYRSASNLVDSSCFPRDRLTSSDLLPQGANSVHARVNPAGAGDIQDQNFLTAGYHIGVNTVGQSLRNANLQLRYEPPNPQVPVSPWGISTIEPDSRMNGLLDIGSLPSTFST